MLAKVTPCFENGKLALVDNLENGAGFATSEVHVIRPDPKLIDPRYLCYVLSSEDFKQVGIASMEGASGLRRVPEEALLNYEINEDDVRKQAEIANFLEREIAEINATISEFNRSVKLLEEKRQSLINAAVAGRIDVLRENDAKQQEDASAKEARVAEV